METESSISYIDPKDFWQKVANEIDGVFKFTQQTQNAGIILSDYFHLRIFKEYQGLNIELHSTYRQSPAERDKFGLSNLRIETELEEQDEFFLYIWRKGFFEKIFSQRRNDDHFEFFKTIGYKTNRKEEIESLFSRKEIQDLIFGLETSVFNIQYDNEKLKIKYQTNETIMDGNILLSEYLKYIKFIYGLLKEELIKPQPVTAAKFQPGLMSR